MRWKSLFVLCGLATALLVPTHGLTQFPGGGGGGRRGGMGGGGMRGMMGGDPGQMFDQFSQGKGVMRRSDMTDPRQQMMFDRFAQMTGSTNGEITREQFITGMQNVMSQMGGGGSGRGGGMQGGGFNRGGPNAIIIGGPQAPGGANAASPQGQGGGGWGGGGWGGGGMNMTPEAIDQMAVNFFRQQDTNKDGFLNYDEMTEELRAERDKWDTNHDGLIDLEEYKVYFKARMQQWMADRGGQGAPPWMGGSAPDQNTPEEDPRPVVYRAGKLPKDLPAWFKEYDTDGDLQIGLYEWKKTGEPLSKFQEIDRNNDGFLTIDEVMRWVGAKKAAEAKKNGTNGASSPSLAMGPGGNGSGNANAFPGGGNWNRGGPGRGFGGMQGGGNGMRGFGGGMNPGGDRSAADANNQGGQGQDRPGGRRGRRGGFGGGQGNDPSGR